VSKDEERVLLTCLQVVGASVSACTRLTVLKFKLVQIIFFASIVYNICLGKYFGSEGVKEHCRDAAMTLVIETQGTKRNTKRPEN